ncbi:SDR family NAD(P)-dependent oxidoreductase [Acinetobacter marinus]|uniref:SDR family NAD(P)-dependent oxidoreductase n=1 Tax=Acinetobacter marinus TaxID=281375 RepID=UPI000B835C62|nr:SDR family NAD(P)-dependent oxidoreductase [Acinetobacter marinus]
MKNFQGKVVAITGAGSGIGRALAIRFAQAGCDLALSDINYAAVEATKQMVNNDYDCNISCHQLDVSDRKAFYAWANHVVAYHGKVNMIINNAGVALSGTVDSLSIEDYEWIMDINVWGVIYGTKAFLPYLEQSGEGHIVNISSIFGLTSQPLMSGYNTSKFAVRGFTESLRQDLALTNSCVSATCVHPGGIKTNIAQAARVSDSVAEATGKDSKAATKDFEMTFITTPEKAADTIFHAVKNDKRRVLVGPDAKVYDWVVRLMPTGYQKIMTAAVKLRSNK